MTFEYELSKEDFYEFYRFHYWNSQDKRKYRIKSRLIAGFFLFLMPFLFHLISGDPFYFSVILNLLFFAILLFIFGFYYFKTLVINSMVSAADKLLKESKNVDLLAKSTMEFIDDIIVCKSENSETKINYKMIEKVRDDCNYYFIYVNVVSAYIIPKKIFQSDFERIEFSEIIKQISTITEKGKAL